MGQAMSHIILLSSNLNKTKTRQREEYARHRFCRAHFAQAHGKEHPVHFYPVKNFAVRFGKRQRTAQFVVVRNT
jgi:hypothetical protein